MKILMILLLPFYLYATTIALQILGSGGPEFSMRASSSYLIWVDGKARVMVDMGGGSFLRFTQSKAEIKDLKVIALTHLHIDHSADLPLFMKAGFFTERKEKLPILGTSSKGDFPDIYTFLTRFFGAEGVYAYMQDILTPKSESFQIEGILRDQKHREMQLGVIKIGSVGVHHGPVPSLAYAFEIAGKKIVFTGDTSGDGHALVELAKGADYLVAHHAISQHAGKLARQLHMTPAKIGQIAKAAGVKHLVLSHRMKRTYGKENESEALIRAYYKGDIIWAEDMMKIQLTRE